MSKARIKVYLWSRLTLFVVIFVLVSAVILCLFVVLNLLLQIKVYNRCSDTWALVPVPSRPIQKSVHAYQTILLAIINTPNTNVFRVASNGIP